MSRTLLVWGEKEFEIEVPDDAKVTFGPFSPPAAGGYSRGGGSPVGTLRIYKGTKATENVVAVFSGVAGFRDASLGYIESSVMVKAAKSKPTGYPVFSYDELSDDAKEELAALIAGQLAERALDDHDKDALSFEEEEDDDEPRPAPF